MTTASSAGLPAEARLRPAESSDLSGIVRVQPDWWGGRDLTALLQPLFLEHFATSSLVLEENGELLAFLVGFPSLDHPDEAYVHFVGVRPERRGQGLGRLMHDEFAARMRTLGVRRVSCVTSPANSSSVAFHTSIGFRVTAQDDRHVHLSRDIADPVAGARLEDPRPLDPPWPTAQWPVPPDTILRHGSIELTLTTPDDAPELFAALDDDRVWAHVRGRPTDAHQFAESLVAAPGVGRTPWTVRRAGVVVGTTSYLEVSPIDARLEIGFTLYAHDVWGTRVNPACKYLLLGWAFDHGFGRVQLKTDIRNHRSQAAIARLGAQYEGVLRRYQRRQDGSVRDTVVFSVTAEDWPAVRDGLRIRVT